MTIKLPKDLKEKYNLPSSVIMVTSYPARADRSVKKLNAVASYADHLTPELSNNLAKQNRRLVILAEILEMPEVYEENGVLVCRCWKRNDPKVLFQVLSVISKFSKIGKIFTQFEFNMFGGAMATGFTPLFLFLLKLKRKNTTILLHQVVENLSELSQHINLKEGSIKLRLLQLFLRNFYIFVLLTAHKVIVHDEILKQRLLRMHKREIHVIPHGQGEYKDVCALINARQQLNISKNDFVILCFGFVTWYKGTDWIVKKFLEFYNLNPELTNVRLILAGGESANLRDKPHYRQFYTQVANDTKKSPYILHTGFVADQDVPLYFCASDIAVLPYRTQMSASGPLAIALSFNRPFLLSESIKGLLETFDIKEEMGRLNIQSTDILFSMKDNSLFEKIYNLVSNKSEIESLSKLSSAIREKRDWKVTSRMFIEVIDAKS